jgi:hypothetical protein
MVSPIVMSPDCDIVVAMLPFIFVYSNGVLDREIKNAELEQMMRQLRHLCSNESILSYGRWTDRLKTTHLSK